MCLLGGILLKLSTDLLLLLPQYFREIKDFKYLMNSLNTEVQYIYKNLQYIELQCNISTADENTILKWEKVYNIQSKMNETLEFRRFRIKNRFKENVPLTKISLISYLDDIVGEFSYIIEEDYNNCTLNIHIELGNKDKLNDVKGFLYRNLPANILCHLMLRYNTHSKVGGYYNSYLKVMTHKNIREEVLS